MLLIELDDPIYLRLVSVESLKSSSTIRQQPHPKNCMQIEIKKSIETCIKLMFSIYNLPQYYAFLNKFD